MADMVDDLVFSFLYITPFARMLQQFIINKTLYNLLFLEQLKMGVSCKTRAVGEHSQQVFGFQFMSRVSEG